MLPSARGPDLRRLRIRVDELTVPKRQDFGHKFFPTDDLKPHGVSLRLPRALAPYPVNDYLGPAIGKKLILGRKTYRQAVPLGRVLTIDEAPWS